MPENLWNLAYRILRFTVNAYTKSLSKHENVKCCFFVLFVFFVVKKRGIPRTLKAIWYYVREGVPD